MPRKVRRLTDVRAIALRALRQGGEIRRDQDGKPILGSIYWDISGGCENPWLFTIEGRGPHLAGFDAWGDVRKVTPVMSTRPYQGTAEYGYDGWCFIDIDSPCRRCDVCLRRRAARWRYRAQEELAQAPRTWFGTLSLRPEAHWQMQCRASARLGRRSCARRCAPCTARRRARGAGCRSCRRPR